MTCTGVSKAPSRTFKSPCRFRLPSGRYRSEPGRGVCPDCGGVYVTRRGDNDVARIGPHKALRDCTPQIQKQHRKALMYLEGQSPPTHWGNTSTWAGSVDIRINIVEHFSGMETMTRGSQQTWISGAIGNYQPFRMEITSGTYLPITPMTGGYIYAFNGLNFVHGTGAITVATDYATWNVWNQTLHLSHNTIVQTNHTWEQWVTVGMNGNARQIYQPPARSQAEIEDDRRRNAEALFQRVEAQNLAKAGAQQQAERTLLSLLTEEQRAEYQARKRFHVRGSRGTLYRINHGSSGNVRQVRDENDERGIHAYCAHPAMTVRDDEGKVLGNLPHEDAMIHQFLALISDEDAFLAVANRHW